MTSPAPEDSVLPADPALPAEADEADALEQRTDLVDESGAPGAGVLGDDADPEADEADVAEQGTPVGTAEDDYPAAGPDV